MRDTKKKHKAKLRADAFARCGSLYGAAWDEHEVQSLRDAFGLELTLTLSEVTPDFANTIGALSAERSER